MSDFVLTLDGIGFRHFEIPDEIIGGGGQQLQVHRYAGGDRTIDAFGPDPAPITWEAKFLGPDAEERCQQLDAMRAGGESISLSWSSFSYLVVIREFRWKYRKFWEIDYQIVLEVLVDDGLAGADEGDPLESVMQGDMDDAAGFSGLIGDSGLSSLTGGLFSLAGSVSSIVAAPASFLAEFSGQVEDTLGYVEGLVTGDDSILGAIPPFVSGLDPQGMVTDMLSAATSSSRIASAFAMQNTLGRLQRSVADIIG